MTKFETIGVQAQLDAESTQDALRHFKWSCNCCCYRGMKLDCDRCAIAYTHREMLAILGNPAKTDKIGENDLTGGGEPD